MIKDKFLVKSNDSFDDIINYKGWDKKINTATEIQIKR